MIHTGLSVIESRWWSKGNNSVRPLFETLAGIVSGNPHHVRYDMFSDKSSLSKTIQDIASDAEFHSLYLGAHGDETSISGLNGESISRTELRNILHAHNHGSISGVYFGSCLVATPSNASFWLNSTTGTGLQWVAGYTKSVDWIDSSAVDMVFWSKYLDERRKNKSRKKDKKSDIQMIRHATSEMKVLMPTIFTQLGFNVYYLDTGGQLTSVW